MTNRYPLEVVQMHNFIYSSLITLAGVSILVPIVSSNPTLALVTSNTAVITNTGSTNTIGYRIYVSPSGQVSYVDGNGRSTGTISARLAKKLFQDLRHDNPLSSLPTQQPCRKSTSFGTSTFVALGGERSPDLSCPGNNQAKQLLSDVSAIVKALNVSNIPRSQGHELPPQNF